MRYWKAHYGGGLEETLIADDQYRALALAMEMAHEDCYSEDQYDVWVEEISSDEYEDLLDQYCVYSDLDQMYREAEI